ncbi:hypothetical protein HNQ43_001398 [Faecalicoccus acidiformans]|uniref:DUF4230 domain-containing protein n=1 Tax=Faecalicoccus acidiformans TaxID=915173 RepID=A0A7W8D3K3_9FIRM|nr:DUF4230 domain-containing protein [Faecalicoccus acidiformans]MBB5185344.1 hypothetical protein [Faecalicoccus acidiformans]
MKKIKSISILIIAILSIAAVLVGVKTKIDKQNDNLTVITKSTLKEMINISDLSTYEAIYNGIATVKNTENKDRIDYYVSYEATVKAGINFEELEIQVDQDKKIVTVTIPEIKITKTNVDISSLEYIFINNDANTETVSSEAYKRCVEDVENEVKSTDAIYNLAKQNATNSVEALISPFLEQADNEYKLKII